MQIVRADLSAKLDALRACPYFAGVDDSILAKLAEGMRLARFERSEAVFWQDEACAGLHIIRSGSVKLFKLSPQGREFIVNLFEAGATFNEVPVFDGQQNPINVEAREESEIWIIEPQLIRNTLEAHPEMHRLVMLNLAKNLRMMVGIIEEMSFYQVTFRLARLISQMTPEQLAGEAAERVTQDQLAARLGTVREVVARSLRELERSGAIRMSQRRIYVVDRAVLHEWAERPK